MYVYFSISWKRLRERHIPQLDTTRRCNLFAEGIASIKIEEPSMAMEEPSMEIEPIEEPSIAIEEPSIAIEDLSITIGEL